jgi:hypothetical protein
MLTVRLGRVVCAAFMVAAVLMLGARPSIAEPITWNLENLSFDYASGVVGGIPGSITATGWFIYNADTHTYSNWDITVTGGTDPLLDKTYTPSDSYVPSIYTTLAFTNVEFVFLAPGLSPNFTGDYVNGTLTSMIALDFHDDPYGTGSSTDPGLTDQGGTFSLLTGITRTYDFSNSTTYEVRTGSLSAATAATPEPSSMLLAGTGAAAMLGFFLLRRRALLV